jgi:tetratricopeptide (TPR) repeat protein
MRLCVIVPFLLCLFEPLAWADDPALASPRHPDALLHFKRGNRLYRVRKINEAISSYQAGAAIEPVPVFDFNLGQSYRQSGKYQEAVWHYERFLRQGQPRSDLRALVLSLIARVKGELERQAVSQPPVESLPPPKPFAMSEPLQHHPSSRAEERRGIPVRRRLAIALGAGGFAIAGLGLAFGLRAQSFEDDAAALCAMRSCERADEANGLIDRGKTSALYANVAFGAGGAAILGAAVLWFVGNAGEHENTTVVPLVSRTSAGIAASLRF